MENTSLKSSQKIKFLDLRVEDEGERSELLGALKRVMSHGIFVLGPEVENFEKQIAFYTQRKHCIGVGTGTDALLLALKALDIGNGCEVITTPLSWLATSASILQNGARAVFADVDRTLTIDPKTIEGHITERTKAILIVNFTGTMCDMEPILKIAEKHNLYVIEDGAQSFGATLNGKPSGSFGHISCISMNAMKVLGGLGDAGVVLTNDDAVAKRVLHLRHSGVVDRDTCIELSHNCRLDALQAAFLLERLKRLPANLERRRSIAQYYDQQLQGMLEIPTKPNNSMGAYYTYPVLVDNRDDFAQYLESHGVEVRIQHPMVLNDQPAFKGNISGHSPMARDIVERILCLPLHEKLTSAEQDRVIDLIRSYYKN